MVILVHALVALAGLLLYALAQGKPSEVGRIIFWCAFFVIMLRASSEHVRLF